MALQYPESSGRPRRNRIHPVDVISSDNKFVDEIPAARIDVCVFLVTSFWGYEYALLYHCIIDNEMRTFLRGKFAKLGLDDPEEEKECLELRGKSLVQGLMSGYGATYVLTQEGVVYSMGGDAGTMLGRSTLHVPRTMFGEVQIGEPILDIACGLQHCLAMSASKVFAFGDTYYGRTLVPNIYTGTGGQAPKQVAAGNLHSAILTMEGRVLTFGDGEYGSIGHGEGNNADRPTVIETLKSKIEQIGCTDHATYFRADGKMYGCGLDIGNDKPAYEPTLINTKGHVITYFRCSLTVVVAYTQLHDALVWGDNENIKVLRMEKIAFPGEFFFQGRWKDTNGAVYPVCACNLQHRCRKAILKNIFRRQIDDLPLPRKLKDFLKYGEMQDAVAPNTSTREELDPRPQRGHLCTCYRSRLSPYQSDPTH